MDSSSIREGQYESQSDQFLNNHVHHEDFPINPKISQQHQVTSKLSNSSSKKKKKIAKQPKTTSSKPKPFKRRKGEQANTQMGRPSNQDIEKYHLAINRSFNDIVYHFSRLMIFLKLKQGIQTSSHAMELQNYQSAWMSQAETIMSVENFPKYQQQKPAFLLHPNSLHFLFQNRHQKQKKANYNEQEVKYMLFAFLKKRKMLTSSIYHYINNYWPDIVFLVNNPESNQQIQNYHMQLGNSGQVEDMVPSEQISSNNKNNSSQSNKRAKKDKHTGAKANKNQASQMEVLKKQLADDDSIAAYQIACYLHACCLRFDLKIAKEL